MQQQHGKLASMKYICAINVFSNYKETEMAMTKRSGTESSSGSSDTEETTRSSEESSTTSSSERRTEKKEMATGE